MFEFPFGKIFLVGIRRMAGVLRLVLLCRGLEKRPESLPRLAGFNPNMPEGGGASS